jgi:ribosome-binding factor A
MSSRRQKKVESSVKEIVSNIITQHLSDPRIKGIVSVTRVETSPDLKNAEVFLSIMNAPPESQETTFFAIKHASGKIQAMLGKELRSRYCPKLHFQVDKQFKKAMDTISIIDEITAERKQEEAESENKDNNNPES